MAVGYKADQCLQQMLIITTAWISNLRPSKGTFKCSTISTSNPILENPTFISMASPAEGATIFRWDFTLLNHVSSFHSYSRGLFLLLIFFSLVILITTLFLYAHCICSHRLGRLSADAAAASPARIDPDSIDSLPITLLKKSKGKNGSNTEETECSICLGVFEDEEKLKVLPECNHAYHSECVDRWLSSQSSCPLCRAYLGPVTVPWTQNI